MDPNTISSTASDVPAPKRRLSKVAKEFTPTTKKTTKKVPKKPPVNVKQLEKMYMHQLGVISAVLKEENKYVFKNQFLRLEDYSNLESVRRCFDPLEFVNESSLRVEELEKSQAVVIRSKTYDDIHKAMKYGVWTSNQDNNSKLNEIYKECLKNKQRLLLFFRVVKDNLFCGVAEVISHYIEEQKFNLWWENQKYKGIFNIRWVYVKNLPLTAYNLRENSTPVYELRDGDSLNDKNKNFLLSQFKVSRYSFENSVFKFFGKFDEREDQLISNRTVLDFQFKLQKTERKERGRKRKCSLIEGRSKEELKKISEDQNEKIEEVKSNEEEESQVKKKKKRNKRRRKKKKNDDYYDDYYYDDYYYGDRYDDYYYDDYYYDDYYKRKDDKGDGKNDNKKPKRRRNRRKKDAKKESKKEDVNVEDKPKRSAQPKKYKRRKEPKKKYVVVKEEQPVINSKEQ